MSRSPRVTILKRSHEPRMSSASTSGQSLTIRSAVASTTTGPFFTFPLTLGRTPVTRSMSSLSVVAILPTSGASVLSDTITHSFRFTASATTLMVQPISARKKRFVSISNGVCFCFISKHIMWVQNYEKSFTPTCSHVTNVFLMSRNPTTQCSQPGPFPLLPKYRCKPFRRPSSPYSSRTTVRTAFGQLSD